MIFRRSRSVDSSVGAHTHGTAETASSITLCRCSRFMNQSIDPRSFGARQLAINCLVRMASEQQGPRTWSLLTTLLKRRNDVAAARRLRRRLASEPQLTSSPAQAIVPHPNKLARNRPSQQRRPPATSRKNRNRLLTRLVQTSIVAQVRGRGSGTVPSRSAGPSEQVCPRGSFFGSPQPLNCSTRVQLGA